MLWVDGYGEVVRLELCAGLDCDRKEKGVNQRIGWIEELWESG